MITCPKCGQRISKGHTAHEYDAAVLDMRDNKRMKFREIGDKIGSTRANAHRIYKRAKKNL